MRGQTQLSLVWILRGWETVLELFPNNVSKTKQPPHVKGYQDSLGFWIPDTGFRIVRQWNLDSGFQSLAGFRIPWVEFWIPKLRNPDSTNNVWISVPQTDSLTYLGRPNRLDISPSKYRPWTTFGIKIISNRRVICNHIYKNFNWCHLPVCKINWSWMQSIFAKCFRFPAIEFWPLN